MSWWTSKRMKPAEIALGGLQVIWPCSGLTSWPLVILSAIRRLYCCSHSINIFLRWVAPERVRLQGVVVMKRLLTFALMLVPLFSTAAPPSKAAFSACQNGASSGVVKVEPMPFNSISEDDEYWEGWTANTVDFKGRTVGYARKGDAEGIAYAGRVYPLNLARLINVSRAEYVDQVRRGSIGVAPPADWSWLTDKTGTRFVCVAINRSMDKGTPMAFFLSTAGRTLFFYQGQD